MNIDLDTSTLSLPRDGLIAVRDAHGTRVTAVKGALWITEDHERGDTILEAGQTFTIRRPGLTLIMALEPASLRLAERRCSLSARIVGWLSSFLPPGARAAVG